AVDAANRKSIGAADDRQRHGFGGGDDVGHGASPEWVLRRGLQPSRSSRSRPSAAWIGRSEKLNSTASSAAERRQRCHDGTTKWSRGPNSSTVRCTSPSTSRSIVAVPCPSTTLYTAPSVCRQALPSKPAGSICRNAAIVGIGQSPVAGFT